MRATKRIDPRASSHSGGPKSLAAPAIASVLAAVSLLAPASGQAQGFVPFVCPPCPQWQDVVPWDVRMYGAGTPVSELEHHNMFTYWRYQNNEDDRRLIVANGYVRELWFNINFFNTNSEDTLSFAWVQLSGGGPPGWYFFTGFPSLQSSPDELRFHSDATGIGLGVNISGARARSNVRCGTALPTRHGSTKAPSSLVAWPLGRVTQGLAGRARPALALRARPRAHRGLG